VPAAQYPEVRGAVYPFLEHFASRSLGRWTPEGLDAAILERDKQLWIIGDLQAVCLTSVGPEAVNIEACAGTNRREWQEALDDEIRAWAKALGKKRIIATVRPGWSRWGKTRGYRMAHAEMVLEV
jgi:hypothetical protein